MGIVVIRPLQEQEERLEKILGHACGGIPIDCVIRSPEALEKMLESGELTGSRLLFALTTGRYGVNENAMAMIGMLRAHENGLEGAAGGLIVDGDSEWYTKSLARETALAANMAGCWMVGRPLAEGTKSLYNYRVLSQQAGCSLSEAYRRAAGEVAERVLKFRYPAISRPKILVIHSCEMRTSNTYAAYRQILDGLSGEIEVQEISLRNRMIFDCAGCSYEDCMHYSRDDLCFYGGTITREVYPALSEADALMLLCPNYNDALDANLTAMINRLTSLFRKKPFYDKCLYAVVVSGYSGSDIICSQLIDALNMNKSFVLPGHFCYTKTALAPGSIFEHPDFCESAKAFARQISGQLRG